MRKTNRVSPVIPTVHEGWEATARSTVDGEPGLSSSVGENLPVNLEEETTISTAHNCDTLTSECVSRQTDVRPNESFHPRISESEQEGNGKISISNTKSMLSALHYTNTFGSVVYVHSNPDSHIQPVQLQKQMEQKSLTNLIVRAAV